MKKDAGKAVMSPEEVELAAKRDALEKLSHLLAEKELDLEDLRLALARFQHRYYSEIGRKYVELDELRAQIAGLKAKHRPADSVLRQKAEAARQQATSTAEDCEGILRECKSASQGAESSEAAKRLYRKIASLIHPDKAADDRSRALRTRLMAELNEAYARKDMEGMRTVLTEWEGSPDSFAGEGTAADLVRTIRAIAQVQRRISAIDQQIYEMMSSDIYLLMVSVHEADLADRNILVEMASDLDGQIADARQELSTLQREQ